MVYWARSRVFVHKGGPTHPIYEGPYQAKFLKFCAEGGVSWVKGIPKAQRNNYTAGALADIGKIAICLQVFRRSGSCLLR